MHAQGVSLRIQAASQITCSNSLHLESLDPDNYTDDVFTSWARTLPGRPRRVLREFPTSVVASPRLRRRNAYVSYDINTAIASRTPLDPRHDVSRFFRQASAVWFTPKRLPHRNRAL